MTCVSITEPARARTPRWVRFAAFVVCEVADAVRRMAAALQRSMEISCRRRALEEMPDYLLKDIGISRSEIDYVAVALADGRRDATRRPPRQGEKPNPDRSGLKRAA